MEKSNMHRLLERQVKKSGIDLTGSEEGRALLDTLNKTYIQFERERKILEDSAQRMLEKIGETNRNLHNIIESIDGFNYHVSHDLKSHMINSLTLSKMLAKYLERRDHDKLAEVIFKLNESSSNGVELIDKFLRISQFESQFDEEEAIPIHIPNLIRSIVNKIGLEGKLTLNFEKIGFETIKGKEIGITSLFQNLISNAFKYKKTNTALIIDISLYKNEDKKIISIRDNGIGVDLERDGNKLFKPFVRIENGVDIEGTGVGLFLVKKVVVQHGGEIEVKSKPEVGTEFIITF